MPVSESRSFKKLVRSFEALALPGGPAQAKILAGCAMGAREAIRMETTISADPNASPWPRTKQGDQALQGKQIPSSFSVQVIPSGIAGKSEIDWLEAHQQGHVWPARQAEGGLLYTDVNSRKFLSRTRRLALYRNSKAESVDTDRGSLIVRNYKYKTALLAAMHRYEEHTVGQRVLPERKLVPEGGALGVIWADQINRAADRGLRNWAAEAT
jgi:hypothetical protein